MTTVKEYLIRAFADGREVSTSNFAEQIGASVMAVHRALKEMQHVLHREDRSAGRGKRLVVYRAKDPHGLRAAFFRSGPSFGELLEAWGIARRDIDLPSRVHSRCSDEARA